MSDLTYKTIHFSKVEDPFFFVLCFVLFCFCVVFCFVFVLCFVFKPICRVVPMAAQQIDVSKVSGGVCVVRGAGEV